jgi:hypothetical protein
MRLSALAVGLALVACTAGSVSEPPSQAQPDMVAPQVDAPALVALPDRPSGLIDLDEEGVRRLMGAPEFVWNEAGAAMWRYRGRTCFVDVFLYDGQGVTYVDVRGDGLDDTSRHDCFRHLVEAHAAG